MKKQILISTFLVTVGLLIAFPLVALAQKPWPIGHGPIVHGEQGITPGTVAGQTGRMLLGQGQMYFDSATGNWVHVYAREGYRVGMAQTYSPSGLPITQHPRAVNNVTNGANGGRYVPASMPAGAQLRAGAAAAGCVLPRTVTIPVVPAGTVGQALCPHGLTFTCFPNGACGCADPNAPNYEG